MIGFHHFRAEVIEEAAGDRAFRATLVRVEPASDGRPPLLTPHPDALRSGAIRTRPLEAVHFQPETLAYGSVVDPVDLAETRAALSTAQSAAEKASADLELARTEAERQKTLYETDHAVSLQALQAARGEQRLDEAEVRGTAGTARLRREVALARYGPVLAHWMEAGTTELDPVLQHRASLLLLTPLPGHAAAALPPEASVSDYHGSPVPARLVSVAFRTDPRIQTISAFYRADDDPANPRFIPGMALSARLPLGPLLTGVAVPASAVLQEDGKTWVYVEEAPGQFRRREISLAQALPDRSGWFQDQGLQAGQTIVATGAALLLAEER